MIRTAPRLWWIVVGITVLTGLVYALWEVPQVWTWRLAACAVLGLGIPHGAADHQLFSVLYADRYGRSATRRFYVAYLGAMLLVALGWWLLPQLTLCVFVGLSAYHFGQANFSYLPQEMWLTRLLSFNWGLWVILSPVYWHWDSAAPIVETLWRSGLSGSLLVWVEVLWLCNSLFLGGLIIGLYGVLPWRDWLKESLSLGVLAVSFYVTPLLLGFGLFFALWHALPSAGDQIRFFQAQREGYRWYHYWWAIVPFTGIAILSILALGTYLETDVLLSDWWSVIFGAIAALTLPHMLILDKVYKKLEKEERMEYN
ncbi:MAG: hypothetical protein D6772_04045 [Bacteroidetes bacterium]|nr:MAG: hypothetical protein D6772_04045 [Bacteroidota bacterium]